MGWPRGVVILMFGVVNMMSWLPAYGDSIESVLMPGPVVGAHEKYEEQCTKCHTRFSSQPQDELCLDCHEKVNEDISLGKGFHGLEPEIAKTECRSCHTDHIGRDARIVLLDAVTFNHDMTDFPLKGGHTATDCASCHVPDRKHREAPQDCNSCHKKDDIHEGKLGKECANCHTALNWAESKFDHAKTDFDLLGKHKQTPCRSCHLTPDFKGAPKRCNDCHVVDDVHRGQNGEDCGSCHNSSKWQKVDFDHNTKTKFKLENRHADLPCVACHLPGQDPKKTATTCVSCHKGDDIHTGSMGEKCESCHGTKTWRVEKFDHSRKTDFALLGAHKELPCVACHKSGSDKSKTPTRCIGCHKVDDVHQGEQGMECQNCHDNDSFGADVKFDHDLTNFPLIGMHGVAPCESCHTSQAYQDAAPNCQSCHAEDDEHKGTLGEACETCHSANGWDLWTFDHNHNTQFPLEGRHEGLECSACHLTPVAKMKSKPRPCVSCHARDDEHRGGFGRRCESCHTTSSFKEIRMGK